MAKFVCVHKACKAGPAGGALVVETDIHPPPGWAMLKVSIDFGSPRGLLAIIQGIVCPYCAPMLGVFNADSTYTPPKEEPKLDPNEMPPEKSSAEVQTITAADVATIDASLLTAEKA